MRDNEQDPAADDLEIPADDSAAVKGGTGGVYVAAGDVNGEGAAARLPGLHKSTDVTLKRG